MLVSLIVYLFVGLFFTGHSFSKRQTLDALPHSHFSSIVQRLFLVGTGDRDKNLRVSDYLLKIPSFLPSIRSWVFCNVWYPFTVVDCFACLCLCERKEGTCMPVYLAVLSKLTDRWVCFSLEACCTQWVTFDEHRHIQQQQKQHIIHIHKRFSLHIVKWKKK